MDKLPKYDMDELMSILMEELTGDSKPWYWSIPVHAPAFNFTIYADQLDNMGRYMVNKYGT